MERRRGFRPRGPRPPFGAKPPVEVGQELDVTIEGISRRGDGIARIQGFLVFVPRTNTGDKVKIKITRVAPRFGVAEIVQPL